MRAMISGGNAYLRLDGTRGGLSAEREARRILAESEPSDCGSWSAQARKCDHGSSVIPASFVKRVPWRRIRAWTPRQDVRWEAGVALAEALERFIGQEAGNA